jgi:hypothetical protein
LLNRSYQAKIQIAGIVYLHRIIDSRMVGSSLKNLRMFKKLCGTQGLSCVVLATTMWSQVTPEEGERRENELISKQEFWGEMIMQGSTVKLQDRAEVSAIEIIQYILSKRRRMVLDIQEEMASGKTLDETSAGRELEAELARMRKRHEAEMRELREDMLEAQRLNDKHSQDEIAAIRSDLQRKMDQDREDRERMRVTMEELQKERDAELREERQKNYERELAFQKDKAETVMKLKTMELDSKHQIEITRLEYEKQRTETENARLRAIEAKRKEESKYKTIPTIMGGAVSFTHASSTEAARHEESKNTTKPTAFQSLEEFLQSIPALSTKKTHHRLQGRDQLHRVVEEAVAPQLKILHLGDESWLTELVEHNHNGEDNTQFIAKLLVGYALDRPWVLHDRLIKQMIAFNPNPFDPAREKIILQCQHLDHTPREDLTQFLIDPKDNVSGSLWIVNTSKKSKNLPWLPDREIEHEVTTTNLDTLLGMAGFVPIFSEAKIQSTAIQSSFLDAVQDKALRDFQSHVHFETTGSTEWASVSYLREKSEVKECSIFDTMDCISRATVGIEAGVHRFQQYGYCCHRLVFLRRLSNSGSSSTEADSISSIEVTSLELGVLQTFLDGLRQHSVDLVRLSVEAWENEQSSAVGYTRSEFSSIGTYLKLATSSLGLFVPSPDEFVGDAASAAYQSFTDQNPSKQNLLKFLPLTAAIAPILAILGIPSPDMAKDSALDLLHWVALTVQLLALVVQSYARRFTTPMEFSFLDHPVSHFVLEGASFGNAQAKIFALPQTLSCLGDMIGSDVLVFGTDMYPVYKPVDVEITAADLIEIWGPAKLAVVQKVCAS